MATTFKQLTESHIEFIRAQKVFFVGTAADTDSINISPKGLDSLRVTGPTNVIWRNLTGSGNETAAHVLENGRMTLMFCSFETQPLILRLYGISKTIHPRNQQWAELNHSFPENIGARQIFNLQINLVQTSCGFGVPLYKFAGERPTLPKWSEKRELAEVENYWKQKNKLSIDGKETGIVSNDIE